MIPDNYVKSIRQHYGLTVRVLGEKSNVPKSTVSAIENLESDPRLSDVIKISHALDCEVPEVFDLDYESMVSKESNTVREHGQM